MERTTTARIDLQKLQVLNDRLALCLDALHQVRMSAHAPQAHLGFAPSYGVNPIGQILPQQFGYGVNPIAQQFGYGVSPIGYSPVAGIGFGGIPAWNSWNPAFQGMGIASSPWHVGSTYGVETRPGYTNGAFPSYAPAPTSQVW